MIYLTFAVITSASIALIFKLSENRKLDRFVVTSTNYFTASLISLILIVGSSLKIPVFSFNMGWGQLQRIFPLTDQIATGQGSVIWAIVIGIPSGLFFFLAFIFYQKGINEEGASLAGAFSKIGILVPMTISILLWNEIPTILQSIGIGLAIVSILIVNLSVEKFSLGKIRVSLLLLFLFSGLAEFSNKVFQKYALIDYKIVFLFFVFFTAFLISVLFLLSQKRKPGPMAVVAGILVGIPNLFCSYFLILALDQMKASVAFPIYTSTAVVLINLGGYLFFKEKVSKKERLSIVFTILALVLVNVS